MWALAFALSLGLTAGATADSRVTTIDINSDWGGLGNAQSTSVHIARKADGYSANGTPISAKAVDDLVAALSEPQIGGPDLANLGMDRAWLAAHSVPEELDSRLSGKAPNQMALYKAAITNPKTVLGALDKIYSLEWRHTDDYPAVKVAVVFADGSKLAADSLAQQPLMLPWTVTAGGQESLTYNAHIARALAALLPQGAANKGRLSGSGFESELSEYLAYSLEDRWNTLDAGNRAPATMALLRTRYSIRNASISDRNFVDYLTAGADHTVDQSDAFDAELVRGGFPPGFAVSLELRFDNGTADSAGRFLQAVTPYEDLVLSVPWLKAFVHRHPATAIRLDYVHTASLSENALAAFTADMHAIGRDDLAAMVAPQRARAAVLSVGGLYVETAWIVLPDRRMVLWHYGGTDGLFEWKPEDFVTRPCSAIILFQDGGCAGAVIAPGGEIVDRGAAVHRPPP